MALKNLQLSLQFGMIDDVTKHRAALSRHSVTRWIRHALECDAEITVRTRHLAAHTTPLMLPMTQQVLQIK